LVAAPRGARGEAAHRVVRRDVVEHHRVRADPGAVADLHRTDDLGAGADEDVASDLRALPPLSADGHLVLDVDVAAGPDAAVDDDAVRVNEHEARAELGAS